MKQFLNHILGEMRQCPQRPDYHPEGDVWTHTAYVMNQFHRFESDGLSREDIRVLEYAIFFHDIGKIDCTKRHKKHGHWTSLGHAKLGTRYVDGFKSLIPEDFELIRWIVECHMKIKFKENLSDEKIRELKRAFGDRGWNLLNRFTTCDDMLKYMDRTTEDERSQALDRFEKICNTLCDLAGEKYNPFDVEQDQGNLVLLRGVPGSGKTEFASVMDPDYRTSADDFFVQDDGSYRFEANKLSEAHSWCQTNVWNKMGELPKGSVICVDNTFTQVWEMIYYYHAASVHGYTVRSVIIENRHNGQNTHRVGEDHIERMKQRFQISL